MKLISTILLFLGITFFVYGGYQLFLRENPTQLAFQNYTYQTTVSAEGKALPTSITISDENIKLPVYQVHVANNKWPVRSDGANYVASSPIPGDHGNSIIYAHDWNNLFGRLVYAKPGQKVVIGFADGSQKTFTITYTSTVSQNESTILAPSKDNRITLYTCTGLFDLQRFVVVATLNQ